MNQQSLITPHKCKGNLPFWKGIFMIAQVPDPMLSAICAMTGRPMPDLSPHPCTMVVKAKDQMLAYGVMCHRLGFQGFEIDGVVEFPAEISEEEVTRLVKEKQVKASGYSRPGAMNS